MNATSKITIRRNLKLISWFNLFIGMRFINVVAILFFAEVTGSYAFGMFIITLETWSSSLFEIPTGMLSDRIGRKKTMSLAVVFDILAMLTFGCAGLYNSSILLIIGAILSGYSMSLYSGTEEALIYETMSELRKKKKYHEALGKVNSMYQISAAIGAIVGASLVHIYSYNFVIFLSVIPLLICFIISLFFVEPKIHKQHKDNSMFSFKDLSKLFRDNKKLCWLSVAKIIKYGSDNSSHCFEATFFEMLVPMWLIGFIRAIKQLGGAVSFWFAGKVINKLGYLNALMGCISGNFVATVSALLINTGISPFIMSSLNLFYGVASTAETSLLQKEFSNKQRATMGSIVAFFSNIIFGLLSVIAGYIADYYGVIAALYVLVFINVFSAVIYKRVLQE